MLQSLRRERPVDGADNGWSILARRCAFHWRSSKLVLSCGGMWLAQKEWVMIVLCVWHDFGIGPRNHAISFRTTRVWWLCLFILRVVPLKFLDITSASHCCIIGVEHEKRKMILLETRLSYLMELTRSTLR